VLTARMELKMKVKEFKEVLNEALILYMEDGLSEIKEVKTFEKAGSNGTSEELMVRTKDGSEFQLFIIRSI
jgi:hypothetical protein